MANFKVILAKRRAGGLHLLDLRGQEMPAVLALFGQDGPNLVNSFGGHHGSMGSAMAGLSTRLPPTLLSPASRAWLTGSVHRRMAAWRSSWSSVCEAPIGAPNPRFAFRHRRSASRRRRSAVHLRLPYGGVLRSLAVAAHFPGAVAHGWAGWPGNGALRLPLVPPRRQPLSHSSRIK